MKQVWDLTQTIAEGHPCWPGGHSPVCRRVDTTAEADGYATETYTLGGDCCTHVDSPAHFFPSLPSICGLEPTSLIAPLCVVDVRNVDGGSTLVVEVTLKHILEWESKHGPIPRGAFVAMRSGYGAFFSDVERYSNDMKFPGFGLEAAKYLLEEPRAVVGIGVDTLSADAGVNEAFPVHQLVLGASKYQVENMNLEHDSLPAVGATICVAPLKIKSAPESPARVFA
eukprot:PhM_4_TR12296/c0_g1_i1/m.2305